MPTSRKKVLELLKPYIKGKNVLDAGCTDFSFHLPTDKTTKETLISRHHLFAQIELLNPKRLCGVDINKEGLKLLSDAGFEVCFANLESKEFKEKINSSFKLNQFDVVFSAGVLDHIFDLGTAVENLYSVCSENGTLILTIPNSLNTKFFFNRLLNRGGTGAAHERVKPVVSRHLTSFVPETIVNLLESKNFYVTDISYFDECGSTILSKLTNKITSLRPSLFPMIFIVAKKQPAKTEKEKSVI